MADCPACGTNCKDTCYRPNNQLSEVGRIIGIIRNPYMIEKEDVDNARHFICDIIDDPNNKRSLILVS